MNLCGAFVLLSPRTLNDYNPLLQTNEHTVLIYIAHYLAATCFGRSPSSGSAQTNSLEAW